MQQLKRVNNYLFLELQIAIELNLKSNKTRFNFITKKKKKKQFLKKKLNCSHHSEQLIFFLQNTRQNPVTGHGTHKCSY